MPLTMTMTDSDFEKREENEWYPATIVGFEEADDAGYGPGIKWILELEGEEGREQWAFSSQKLSPRSKTYKWVKGIDESVLPEPGGVFNIEVLAGRSIFVEFGPSESNPDKQVITRMKGRKGTGSKVADNAIARNNRKAAEADDDDKF